MTLLHGSVPNRLVARTKIHVRFVTIVRSAPKLDVLGSRFAAVAMRTHMVEFQEASLRTALAFGGHEGTSPAIASPDLSPHPGGNVP
jgi:hypothetical protein